MGSSNPGIVYLGWWFEKHFGARKIQPWVVSVDNFVPPGRTSTNMCGVIDFEAVVSSLAL